MAKSIEAVNNFRIAGENEAASSAAASTVLLLVDGSGGTADATGDIVQSAGANPTAAEFEANMATLVVTINQLKKKVDGLATLLGY